MNMYRLSELHRILSELQDFEKRLKEASVDADLTSKLSTIILDLEASVAVLLEEVEDRGRTYSEFATEVIRNQGSTDEVALLRERRTGADRYFQSRMEEAQYREAYLKAAREQSRRRHPGTQMIPLESGDK